MTFSDAPHSPTPWQAHRSVSFSGLCLAFLLQASGLRDMSRWWKEPAKRGDWNHREAKAWGRAPKVARETSATSRATSVAHDPAMLLRWFRYAAPPANFFRASGSMGVTQDPLANVSAV